MTHYYNEIEPYAAQWLRNLIAAGHLPAGEVDTRSIVDVQPDDLHGFTQCHFFAGIGGWALAARLVGWPDSRELWTGSCPCQPFSVAGKQRGHDDERHLWPHQLRLLSARRPAVWMGEQVAAAVGKDWLDGVLADVEAIGYAGRAAVVPACAVDGPHRRDRLWIVAERDGAMGYGERARLEGHAGHGDAATRWAQPCGPAAATGRGSDVGHPDVIGAGEERQQRSWEQRGARGNSSTRIGAVADAHCFAGGQGRAIERGSDSGSSAQPWAGSGRSDRSSAWSGASWIVGHDGKARRVEPGIRLLAHGVPARVGRLRAYGNAIVPQVAAEVIAAYMETRP